MLYYFFFTFVMFRFQMSHCEEWKEEEEDEGDMTKVTSYYSSSDSGDFYSWRKERGYFWRKNNDVILGEKNNEVRYTNI